MIKQREPAQVRRLTDIHVVDGDSFECRSDREETRVRLYGIDAPELGQLGGQDAAERLAAIIQASEPLLMEVMDIDQYGRVVGLLYSRRSSGTDSVNLRMVREGYAYAFTRFGGGNLGFKAAQHDARRARRGIWRGGPAGGERPWDYRRRMREEPIPESALLSLLIRTKLGRIILFIGLAALVAGAIFVELS